MLNLCSLSNIIISLLSCLRMISLNPPELSNSNVEAVLSLNTLNSVPAQGWWKIGHQRATQGRLFWVGNHTSWDVNMVSNMVSNTSCFGATSKPGWHFPSYRVLIADSLSLLIDKNALPGMITRIRENPEKANVNPGNHHQRFGPSIAVTSCF